MFTVSIVFSQSVKPISQDNNIFIFITLNLKKSFIISAMNYPNEINLWYFWLFKAYLLQKFLPGIKYR